MDTTQKDDYIEFTVIAGENDQYSNTISGTAEELNVTGYKTSNLEYIGEEAALEEFVSNCHDDFMGSYGSYYEFAETNYRTIKLTRKDGSVVTA